MAEPSPPPGSAAAGRGITIGDAAAIGLGIISFLSQGVLPLLLGLLEATGLLDGSGIGLAASAENLVMTLVAGIAAVALPPRRLRSIAVGATLLLVCADAAILVLRSQPALIAARGLAGAAEGLLFWIALGTIARSRLAERAAASLVIGSTVAGLLLTLLFNSLVTPRFGVRGDFAAMALVSLIGLALVPLIPDRYPPLARQSHDVGLPSARGAAALLAAMLFNAAGMGFAIYLVPLSRSAGLDPDTIAGPAITALLAGQFAGSVLAAAIAGRANYFVMLCLSAAAYGATWPIYALHSSAATFIALNFALGLVTFFAIPFLYPFAAHADPTRRAAVLSGPAQMLGSATGPFMAAAVADGSATRLVELGFLLLAAAMVIIVALGRPSRRPRPAGPD